MARYEIKCVGCLQSFDVHCVHCFNREKQFKIKSNALVCLNCKKVVSKVRHAKDPNYGSVHRCGCVNYLNIKKIKRTHIKDPEKWRKIGLWCIFIGLPILIILEGSNHPIPVVASFLCVYLFMKVLVWIMDLLGISDGSSTLDDDGD